MEHLLRNKRDATSIRAWLVRVAVLLVLVCLSSHCGRETDDTQPDRLWKPKKGTEYLGDLPKEIIWLKDGAEMVLVPGGEFLFGEHKEKRTLHSFYTDKYLVTNKRYQRFVKAAGHRAPYVDEKWAKPLNWKGKKYPKGKGDYPVVIVGWYDATAYCEWAGKSLPTEEQWEKAARGTDGRAYPWGNEFDEKKCNCYLTGIEALTPVGKFPEGASPHGCHDMAGNVWEWTKTGKIDGFVMKGGSFFEGDVRVRSFGHVWGKPHVKGQNCGFRTCYVLPK
jgi:formylglycine-generating enzyme required for sulfatase activity